MLEIAIPQIGVLLIVIKEEPLNVTRELIDLRKLY